MGNTMKRFSDIYTELENIGEGGFGKVKQC